ncbi:MAG: hypothetical protein GXW89_00890 [Phycisphaerae bacterium]|nr:hypothetical protein [Phycisphaerae bacterium]
MRRGWWTGIVIGLSVLVADGERTAARAAQGPPVTWRRISSDTGELPVPPANSGQAGLRVVDLDGDGQTDYLVTLWSGPAVVWYRRSGSSFQEYIIEPQVLDLSHGEKFKDIDGDGDIDLIFGQAAAGNDIYWWENPHPNYSPTTPWTRRVVRNTGGNFYHDSIWGDFDGDGSDEYVSWNQSGFQLLLFEIPADPKNTSPWPATPIFSWPGNKLEYRGMDAADINLDGKIDLVAGGGWFEHTGGTNFVFHPIDPEAGYTQIKAGQLIPGGRPEVVCLFELRAKPLNMYEWQDGSWQTRTILPHLEEGHTLQLGDVNLDGHLDILVAELGQSGDSGPEDPHARIFILYGDGTGNFVQQVVYVGQGLLEGQLADIDDDGDLDIVGNSFRHNAPRMDIWINEGWAPTIVPRGGTYTGQVAVGLFAAEGHAIHYTTDGTPPTAASPQFQTPFTINQSTLVRAVTVKDGVIVGSSQASFVIEPDVSPPVLVAASAAADPTQVKVRFSEPVTQATAESIANYVIDQGVEVTAAVLDDDFMSVTLTTSPLLEQVGYTLTINNITDRSANANPIAANSQYTFRFSPLPTQDLALWLRADAGVVLNGSTVARWSDQSGNNRRATQSASFAQPTVTAGALNGYPVVSFDGLNDYLAFDLPINGLTGMSLFLVAANTQDQAVGLPHHAARAALFWNETEPWGTVYLAPFQTKVHLRFGTTGTGTHMTYSRPVSVGSAFTRTAAIKDGSIDRLYVDGHLVLSQGGRLLTLAGHRDTGNLGRGHDDDSYFAGHIAEVLVFTRALSEAEREQVERYLADKYFVDEQAPTAPSNLQAIAVSPTQIDLSWTAATDNVAVSYYRVLRDGHEAGTTPHATFSDTELTPLTEYTYTVIAVDQAGNESPASAAVSVTTPDVDLEPPTVPAGLVAVVIASDQIKLSWIPSMDNVAVSHYRVLRDDAEAGTTGDTTFLDTGLQPQTLYTYRVVAVDTSNNPSASSAPVEAITLSGPPFPGEGLALWLRADGGVVESGGAVSQWLDLSGHARNAVQSDPASRPLLLNDMVNGRPAVSFDGLNDYLTFDLPINGLTGMSLFLVAANTQDQAVGLPHHAARAALFWNEITPWGTVYLTPFQTEVHLRFGTTGTGTQMTYSRPVSAGSAFTRTAAIKDGATDRLYVDGELVLSQGERLPTLAGHRNIGNLGRGYNDDTYFAGHIAEVLVFTRALSEAERVQVEQYLAGKYSAPAVMADFDFDGDVDLSDLVHLEACLAGPAVSLSSPVCEDKDLDGDGDVDQDDFGIFQQYYNGENRPAAAARPQSR